MRADQVPAAHKLDFPFASDLYASASWQGILKRGEKMMGKRSVEAYVHRPLEELYDVEPRLRPARPPGAPATWRTSRVWSRPGSSVPTPR